MTIAVPVSWHIGRTPPAAMLAFLSRSSATNLSLLRRLGVVEDLAQLLRGAPGAGSGRCRAWRRLGEQGRQRLGLDLEERAPAGPGSSTAGRHALVGGPHSSIDPGSAR
jgi:hypothetical protein